MDEGVAKRKITKKSQADCVIVEGEAWESNGKIQMSNALFLTVY